MPEAMSDRRVATRYALILLAEVTDQLSGTKLTGRTSDVSRAGCYIDTRKPLPRGAKIQVRLYNRNEMFESAATVVYVSPGLGIGIAFEENLAGTQREILDRWLATAAAKSEQ